MPKRSVITGAKASLMRLDPSIVLSEVSENALADYISRLWALFTPFVNGKKPDNAALQGRQADFLKRGFKLNLPPQLTAKKKKMAVSQLIIGNYLFMTERSGQGSYFRPAPGLDTLGFESEYASAVMLKATATMVAKEGGLVGADQLAKRLGIEGGKFIDQTIQPLIELGVLSQRFASRAMTPDVYVTIATNKSDTWAVIDNYEKGVEKAGTISYETFDIAHSQYEMNRRSIRGLLDTHRVDGAHVVAPLPPQPGGDRDYGWWYHHLDKTLSAEEAAKRSIESWEQMDTLYAYREIY